MKTPTLRRAGHRTELRGPTAARVNLMPPEVAEVRRFRRVQYGLGAAVLAAIGVVILLLVLALGSVSSAQQQVDKTQAEQSQLQGRLTRFNGVRQVYTQVAQGDAQLRSALSGEVQLSHYLNDLSLTIPQNVWLTNLSVTLDAGGGTGSAAGAGAAPGAAVARPGIGTLTATGSAFAHEDVANWLETLGREKGFADAYLSNSTEALIGQRRTVTFSSTATVTAAALSHRFDRLPGV